MPSARSYATSRGHSELSSRTQQEWGLWSLTASLQPPACDALSSPPFFRRSPQSDEKQRFGSYFKSGNNPSLSSTASEMHVNGMRACVKSQLDTDSLIIKIYKRHVATLFGLDKCSQEAGRGGATAPEDNTTGTYYGQTNPPEQGQLSGAKDVLADTGQTAGTNTRVAPPLHRPCCHAFVGLNPCCHHPITSQLDPCTLEQVEPPDGSVSLFLNSFCQVLKGRWPVNGPHLESFSIRQVLSVLANSAHMCFSWQIQCSVLLKYKSLWCSLWATTAYL